MTWCVWTVQRTAASRRPAESCETTPMTIRTASEAISPAKGPALEIEVASWRGRRPDSGAMGTVELATVFMPASLRVSTHGELSSNATASDLLIGDRLPLVHDAPGDARGGARPDSGTEGA